MFYVSLSIIIYMHSVYIYIYIYIHTYYIYIYILYIYIITFQHFSIIQLWICTWNMWMLGGWPSPLASILPNFRPWLRPKRQAAGELSEIWPLLAVNGPCTPNNFQAFPKLLQEHGYLECHLSYLVFSDFVPYHYDSLRVLSEIFSFLLSTSPPMFSCLDHLNVIYNRYPQFYFNTPIYIYIYTYYISDYRCFGVVQISHIIPMNPC